MNKEGISSMRTIRRSPVRRRLALAVSTISTATLAALAAQSAFAQEQVEEVTVTGSRIQRDVGFESPVPVTAVTEQELANFAPGNGIASQLASLPQFFNNVSSDNIAGRVAAEVGQSQLNMRGMGAERTLVLLDGERVVPSDRYSSVSVDYLPTTLIQRVDVVTGGASAAYGADALAGVTNFILNRQFTGFDVAYRTGINEQGDGEFNRGSITWGTDLSDTFHVFGSLEARENDAYRRSQEGWDHRQGYVKNPAWISATATPNEPIRLTRDYVYSSNFTSTGLITAPASSGLNRMSFTPDGQGVQPFVSGPLASFAGAGNQNTMLGATGDPQYDEFYNTMQSFERVGVSLQNVFTGFDWDAQEGTRIWGHVLYGRSASSTQGTSSGNAGTSLGHAAVAYMTAYPENPFLPASVRNQMAAGNLSSIRVDQQGYMDIPWGMQETPSNTNTIASFTVGFDQDLWGDWNLRGSYQTGKSRKKNMNNGWERLDRFYMAMDAVTDPQTGQPICRVQLVQRQMQAQGRSFEGELNQWAQQNIHVIRNDFGATTPGIPEAVDYPFAVDSIDNSVSDCVPVNMFGKGNQSKEAIDYIFSARTKTGISDQKMDFAELLANGTLFEGWAGPISGAIGATYRTTHIKQYIVDDAVDNLGAPCNVTLPDGTVVMRGIAPAVNCSATGDNLHRFSGQPEFMGGYHVYEVFGESIIPLFESQSGNQSAELNVAARWSNYSRAGIFTTWKTGLTVRVTQDLRLRGTLSHDIREGSFGELFVQQGRGATINDPFNNNISYTAPSSTSGNPNLKAEQARTTVLGFVYQPSFIEGLSFSADHYDVDLNSAIGVLSEQQTVDACFNTGALCDQITFGPDGLITSIIAQYVNLSAARVRGWDIEASYRMEPDLFAQQQEDLSVRLIAGILNENSSTPLNAPKLDQAGTGLLPDKTATLMVNYNIGDWGLTMQETWQDQTIRNPLWVEGVDVDNNTLGAVNLTNLGLNYSQEMQSGSSWRASLNVNNVFDKPPVIGGTTRIGDELGRRYSLGLDYSF
jgi:outer membrane receptor protein involved in Fe transport